MIGCFTIFRLDQADKQRKRRETEDFATGDIIKTNQSMCVQNHATHKVKDKLSSNNGGLLLANLKRNVGYSNIFVFVGI